MKIFLGIWVLTLVTSPHLKAENHNLFPKRVLLTNDNGIKDIKLIELARAFAQVAETWVVAPSTDRSGSTHFLSFVREGGVRVEKVDLGGGIRAFSVEGYPADCVIWALSTVLRDHPPDLVISGVNGGPNLAHDWLFSGTIGAARVASFGGVPALAVSGLDDDLPGAVEAVADWVLRLAGSEVVRGLEKGQYLTVSIPRVAPAAIKGARVARRAGVHVFPLFEKEAGASESRQLWRLKGFGKTESSPAANTDLSLYEQGYIVVVPMVADEHDQRLLSISETLEKGLPAWMAHSKMAAEKKP